MALIEISPSFTLMEIQIFKEIVNKFMVQLDLADFQGMLILANLFKVSQ
jgi:hypothetical protein